MGHLEYKMGVESTRIQAKALLHKALLRYSPSNDLISGR
jgi:hypothetical protein